MCCKEKDSHSVGTTIPPQTAAFLCGRGNVGFFFSFFLVRGGMERRRLEPRRGEEGGKTNLWDTNPCRQVWGEEEGGKGGMEKKEGREDINVIGKKAKEDK